MTKVVALVCRLSPRPDGSYEGVDAQEQWGREYAAKQWPGAPIEVFADKGISAANDDYRPQFERFREWVRDAKVAHVWAVEQARLERRESPWFELAAELDAAGIGEVHTNRDGVVEVRGVLAGIKAVLNANYVRELKRKIDDKNDWLASEGRPPGVRPFGYRHAEVDGVKTYVIVDEQAEAIRWAAEKVLDGWSLTNVATALREQGVSGRSGGKVTGTTVATWLRSPSLAGFRVHRGQIVGRGNWPAIIDPETWQAVRAKLTGPRVVASADGKQRQITAGHLKPPAGRKYLLTGGLTRCGVCDAPVGGFLKEVSSANKTKRAYMACKPAAGGRGCVGIALEPTEAYVLERLWAELDKPEFLEAVAADDHAARREEILTALSVIEESERPEQATMWGAGELTTGEYRAARAALDDREQRLRGELDALPPPALDVDIEHAREAWPEMMLDEQRAFIRLFMETVTINPAIRRGPRGFDSDRIVIEWRKLR